MLPIEELFVYVYANEPSTRPYAPGRAGLLRYQRPYPLAQSGLMAVADNGDTLRALVSAGNASELSTGTDDLIGISGDAVNGYERAVEPALQVVGQCAGQRRAFR